MKLLQKQQVVIIVLAVSIIAGFATFLYYPLARQTKAVKQADAAQSAAAAKADARKQQLPILRGKVDALSQSLANYDRRIPEKREFAQLWRQVADVMNKHDLKDQLVQPAAEIAGADLNCIPISIRCSGRMEQIYEFLKSMENFERVIRIEHFKLENDIDLRGQLRMNAQANVYYRSSGSEQNSIVKSE
ncbi:MAG: type IV pilus inner membrane component PilO [Planctomycetota bacterium]|jgi:Tfp pilus assembly protein PilO